jgi:hypothetical protein
MTALRGAIRRIVREVSGDGDRLLIAQIAEQLRVAGEGARLAVDVVTETTTTTAGRAEMAVLEHAGDQARAAFIRRLGVSLATPMDREDLYRLSRAVDDVLDTLRDFVRELDLLGVGNREPLIAPAEAVRDAIAALGEAVSDTSADSRNLAMAVLVAKKNSVRRSYQLGLRDVLCAQPSGETIKQFALLCRLDAVGGCLDDAANALLDGVIKRGQ